MIEDPFSAMGSMGPDHYMRQALREARSAYEADEVPVGAVIVDLPSGRIVARAHNQRELLRDPTAHAEIIAITQAAAYYRAWRLVDAAMFVTLEPCTMCAGAIVLARIPRVYYGADDPKAGAHRSKFELLATSDHNHVPQVSPGHLADECGEILRDFFRRKRAKPENGRGRSEADSVDGRRERRREEPPDFLPPNLGDDSFDSSD